MPRSCMCLSQLATNAGVWHDAATRTSTRLNDPVLMPPWTARQTQANMGMGNSAYKVQGDGAGQGCKLTLNQSIPDKTVISKELSD